MLTFDPEERKEFLTGFRKRKLARKAKAREELARQIKAEKIRINKERANSDVHRSSSVLLVYVVRILTETSLLRISKKS